MNRNFPIGLLAPLALIAVLLASSFAFAPERVSAHANLARSDPSSGSVLTQAPDRVAIWFTEPLEPEFSEIRVLDVQGERVDNGGSTVDLNDPTAMSVALPPIAPGTYTVAWRNLSSVDGHAVRGSFVFSVGNATAGAAFSSPEPDQKILQSPLEPVVRWLVLMGVLALLGGFAFELLVTRPVLMGSNSSQVLRQLGQRMTSRTFKLVWIAMAVVLIASLAQLVLQTSLVFEVPLHQAIGSNWISILTETRWGNLWLWRVGLLLPIGALVPFHGESYDNRAEFTFRIGRILGGWLSAAILLTISLASHGAATAEIRDSAIFTDFLHLLAAGFWIGGLFHLALVIPLVLQVPSRTQRYGVLVSLLPRFSIMAILSVGTLIITGLYSGWAQVTVFEALATPYGRTLVAKLVLVIALLSLGALNLFWVRPRLAREDRAGNWMRHLVLGEVLFAVLVLFSVGVLTSLEPARQVASRQGIGQQDRLSFQGTVEGADIALAIEPGRVGLNRFTVTLRDRQGRPITNATDLTLKLDFQDSDLGSDTSYPRPAGDGRYVLDEQMLSIAGLWQVELAVSRPDAFDARTAFRFTATADATSGSATIAPTAETGKLLWGVELGLLGALFLSAGIPLGGWRNRIGAGVMGAGMLSAIAGMVLAFSALGGASTPEPARNPFPPNPESLELGQRVYTQNCQACHGVGGRGDGPMAAQLEPPPLDLAVHVPLHSEGDLFSFVRDGISGTAMPPWEGKLSDQEIWHVVNYIMTFEGP